MLSARIASLAVVLASTAAAQQLYWTDAEIGSFAIRHANLDGTAVQTVVAYAAHPRGLAIDASQGQMYWNDLGTLRIRRADLDGSNAVDITAISNAASGIALDVYSGKIYWTDAGSGSISRCNLNGSSVQALISSGLPYPTAVALNLQAGKMYWTDIVAMKIQRANLDGSSIEDVVINTPGPANGIALDLAAGAMYWSDTSWTNGAIRKANLDGGNATTILSGLEAPTTLALDLWHGKVYWTQTLTSGVAPGIYRANLDGSGPESIVTSYGTPWGLAFDFNGPTIGNYCTAGTTTHGCLASISGTGTPSASASSGFTIAVGNVEGQQQGMLFYGINNAGFTPLPWGTSSSFMCVKSPLNRMPAQNSGGTFGACDGMLGIDWNAYRTANPTALGQPFAAGQVLYAQGWFRDPPSPKTTMLSDALAFLVQL